MQRSNFSDFIKFQDDEREFRMKKERIASDAFIKQRELSSVMNNFTSFDRDKLLIHAISLCFLQTFYDNQPLTFTYYIYNDENLGVRYTINWIGVRLESDDLKKFITEDKKFIESYLTENDIRKDFYLYADDDCCVFSLE